MFDRYSLSVRKGAGAYDLSARYWKCNKCGKQKRPDKGEPHCVMTDYCNCYIKKR